MVEVKAVIQGTFAIYKTPQGAAHLVISTDNGEIRETIPAPLLKMFFAKNPQMKDVWNNG